MTIKFYKLLIISTLIPYILLIAIASDISIIQYKNFKNTISEEEKRNLQLENEIENLIIEKLKLESGEYVLDLALDLGYINDGDEIIYRSDSKDNTISTSHYPTINKKIVNKKRFFAGWKNYEFFLLSMGFGIAFSLGYLLISKKRRH
jgi:cell division protein FtsB